MNLDKTNRWLTLLANIGVMAGIVFLAVEVNQNSAELEQSNAVATAQGPFQVNTVMDNSYRAMAQNPVLAKLVKDGHESPESLTELEREQFAWWLRANINASEAAWFYYDQGLIQEEYFGGYRSATCNRLTTNGGRWWWDDNAEFYADGFISFVEQNCLQ